MTSTHAAYKRPTTEQNAYTDSKWRVGIFQVNGKEKEAGIAIPISDKTDFKKKRPLNTQEITSQHSKEESIKKS